MKYLAIFLLMLVLAYVLSRPDTGPGATQNAERDLAIAEHRITYSMSAGDVLKSVGEPNAITSTMGGRIIWGYKKTNTYVEFTESGVIGVGTLGVDGQPYFTGKDALIFKR